MEGMGARIAEYWFEVAADVASFAFLVEALADFSLYVCRL
jgi:hypothetical protein